MEGNFGAVISAMVAAMLVNARNLFHRLTGRALSRLPFIGDQVARVWADLIEQGWQLERGWIEAALGGLVGVIRRPTDVANALLAAYNGAHAATLGQLWKLWFVRIPQAEGRAYAYTQQVASWLDQEIRRLIAEAEAYALTLRDQAIYYAQILRAQSDDFVRRLYAQALGYTQALHDQETGYAQQLYQRSVDFARQLNAEETTFARALHDLETGYAQALEQVSLRYTRQVEDFARAGIGQAEDYAQALFRDLAQEQIKGERRAEAYAQTLARQIYALPCIQECESLGALGKDLSALDLTGLIVAVLQASKNPQRGAQELYDRFSPPMLALRSEIRQLWNRA